MIMVKQVVGLSRNHLLDAGCAGQGSRVQVQGTFQAASRLQEMMRFLS
jgi:hypothetical protein